MHLLSVLLMLLCLSFTVLADKEVNLRHAPGSDNKSIAVEEISGNFPDSGNYNNREYQGDIRINTLSGWGNDKSDFRLYNPRFDDGNERISGSE